jgi:dockerin type I repeat protein
LIIDAGTYAFAGNPSVDTSNMTVFDYSAITFGAAAVGSGITAQTLAALNLGPEATVSLASAASHADRTVLVVGNLTESSTSVLDLQKNDMIVQAGNLSTITRWLKTGLNAPKGYWNGKGIISSSAAGDTRYLTTLGAELSNVSSFDGVGTSPTNVLVKYTYYGDANLDGVVNGADYQQIDNGFGLHLTGWANGDFNYDGVVNGSDFSLLDNTFNSTNAIAAAPLVIVATPAVQDAGDPPRVFGAAAVNQSSQGLDLEDGIAETRRKRGRGFGVESVFGDDGNLVV